MASTIAIVGAGRVGRGLGRRLASKGWRIGAVVTRSMATARAAVRQIGSGAAYGSLTRHLLGADVILITTPDDAIANMARELAEIGGGEWRGKVVLHTSGALGREVLEPLARAGASTGSFHPMQTFSGREAPDLEGIACAIEGDRNARRVARNIGRDLGCLALAVESRHKTAYHAAGSLVAGHALGLVEAATQILMKSGFTRRQASRALLPLIRQMLMNLERLGPRAAWTGPLSRGDYATVARHQKALREFPHEFGDSYASVGYLIARVLSAQPAVMRRNLEKIAKK